MKSVSTKYILCFGAATASVAVSLPALAQDSTTAGDIIVTARRVEERLQDVPIAITVFNQEQLSNRNVMTAEDLAKTTPGLQVNSNFGAENSVFSLRGFTQEIGTMPSVGVYFADVVAPRGGSAGNFAGDGAGAGSLFDLQNVQVLRGPQGTLQGRNTTGGAILLVPQKPTADFEGYVEGSIGNYDAYGLQAVVNIPIVDTFRIRLGVDRQKRDGYLKNAVDIGPTDFNDIDYLALRASVVGELTPDLENYTIISYANSQTNGSVQKLIATAELAPLVGLFGADQQLADQAALGFYDVFSILPNSAVKKKTWQVINTTTWQASDNLVIKNIISYAELRQSTNSQIFGSNFQLLSPLSGTPYPVYSNMLHHAAGLDTTSQSTFTEELQFQGLAMDSKLRWQAGFYYEKSSPLSPSGNQTAGFSYCPDIGTGNLLTQCYGLANAGYNNQVARTTFEDIAVYAQATYDINEQFSVTGGFRYTWDEMTSVALQEFYSNRLFSGFPFYTTPDMLPLTDIPSTLYCITDWSPAGPGGCPIVDLSKKSSAPTWLINFDYKPTEDVLIYAKYARGYRAGGVKNDAPNLGLIVPGAPNFQVFNPEKLDAYEMGLKSSFRGAISGTFNVAAFHNDFSDQQISMGMGLSPVGGTGNPADPLVGGTPTSAPMNVGKSRIYGLDADVSLNLFEGFVLNAAYAYLNSKVQEIATVAPIQFQNGSIAPNPTAAQGEPLTLSPKNKYTINANYTLPLDESIGEITFGLTFTHTDTQRSTFQTNPYPGNQLVMKDGAIVVDNRELGLLQATDLLDMNINWNNVGGLPVDLTFWATNLTKEKYYTWVTGLIGYGFDFAAAGAPRMYGMKAKVRF